MKILLGFLSAHHPSRWHYRDRARRTFLLNSPFDYRFVLGAPPSPYYPTDPQSDCLYVNCDDRKEFMVQKNQALFQYALDHGYDFCLRCCDDTWVNPEGLKKAGLEKFDYAGFMPCKLRLEGAFKIPMRYLDYMHGGCGIWLSRKAMEMLVEDEWNPDHLKEWPEMLDVGFGLKFPKPGTFWDDHWIGEVLKGNLPYSDPKRADPFTAYRENGIRVFDDDVLFLDDDQDARVTIHDPGMKRIPMSPGMEGVKREVERRNAVEGGYDGKF